MVRRDYQIFYTISVIQMLPACFQLVAVGLRGVGARAKTYCLSKCGAFDTGDSRESERTGCVVGDRYIVQYTYTV